MEMTCEGCSNAAKRVLAKIGGIDNKFMYGLSLVYVLKSFCAYDVCYLSLVSIVVSQYTVLNRY